jgi:hypothetical protein
MITLLKLNNFLLRCQTAVDIVLKDESIYIYIGPPPTSVDGEILIFYNKLRVVVFYLIIIAHTRACVLRTQRTPKRRRHCLFSIFSGKLIASIGFHHMVVSRCRLRL